MMVVGGVRVLHMATLLPFIPITIKLIQAHSYRLDRITGWINPWADPDKTGHNIIQSYYAFANGGIYGLGPGQSQQKLFFLPEPYTDYIFAILGEELGLIGVILTGFLFLALAGRGFMIARAAKNLSGVYLAAGMTLCIIIPAFFNMLVSLSLVPSKGLTLPFFSYGGSSAVVSCAAVGIILAVNSQSQLRMREQSALAMPDTRSYQGGSR
jgi:cell division protein FtsW